MALAFLEFRCEGTKDDTFRVRQAEGTERISGPYRFELELYSRESGLDPARLLLQKACLEIRRPAHLGDRTAARTVRIHGLISAFEQREKAGDWVRYRAALSPRLWKLSLARHNRVFRDLTVEDLLRKILDEAGLDARRSISVPRPVREFTVQYRESDLDFLSRWLEHEGIFYFFEQSDKEETPVFADNSAVHTPIPGESTVPFEPDEAPAGAVARPGRPEGSLLRFWLTARPLPREVVLADWDPRKVEELRASADIDPDGFGKVYEYGSHPADPDHAALLAKVRAEAIRCRGRIFSGTGRCRFFRAGSTFKLVQHYRSDFNREYLLTRVVHRMSQPVEIPRLQELPEAYENEFEAIPADVPFRPERSTPWPRIHGFTEALVVAGGGHSKQDLDDQGCYRIRLLYDKDDSERPSDSAPVRMAQPYAGESFGMHFPLHADTEVLVGHKDGDPDRPVVLSAVPNPKKKSPVVGENATQCVLKSGAGNMIRLEDASGSEDFFLYAKNEFDVRVEKDAKETVGGDKHVAVGGQTVMSVGGDLHLTVSGSRKEEIGADRSLAVGGKEVVAISGERSLDVGGPSVESFAADHAQSVGGRLTCMAKEIILQAPGGITLLCGGSSIVVDPAGVTIKGITVTLDGGLTKINSGPGSAPKNPGPAAAIRPDKPRNPKEATR